MSIAVVREAVRNIRQLGTVAPTFRWAARMLVDGATVRQAKTVVELGPGTGPITREILHRLPPDGRLIAIEINERFCVRLRETVKDPRLVVVHGSAADVARIVQQETTTPVEAVVSALPWSLLPVAVRPDILVGARKILDPDVGRFTTIQTGTAWLVPSMRRALRGFEALLSQTMGSAVYRSAIEWRNIPPEIMLRTAGERAPAPGPAWRPGVVAVPAPA